MVRLVALLTFAAMHVHVSYSACSEQPTIQECYPLDMSGSCYHSSDACDFSGEPKCWHHDLRGKKRLSAALNCYKGRMACNIAVLKELKKPASFYSTSEWKAVKLRQWTPENVKSRYESAEAFVNAHMQEAEDAKKAFLNCAKTEAKHGKRVAFRSGGSQRTDVKTWVKSIKEAEGGFAKEIQAIKESVPSRKKLNENPNH